MPHIKTQAPIIDTMTPAKPLAYIPIKLNKNFPTALPTIPRNTFLIKCVLSCINADAIAPIIAPPIIDTNNDIMYNSSIFTVILNMKFKLVM